MDVQIKEKSAFVTAGAYGIGEAIADLLTQEGARVIVADCDEVGLREKASRWAGVVAADLATAEGIDRAISAVLTAALLPQMAKRGSGSVVNIGSDLAKQPEPTMMDYGVCKAGLLYLTKALAKQYAPHVRVNVVLPGPIWSRMWTRPGGLVDQLVANYGVDKEAAVKRFLEERYMPLGIGQPEDVAQAVVFLASPLAKFITGSSLDIGGTLQGLV